MAEVKGLSLFSLLRSPAKPLDLLQRYRKYKQEVLPAPVNTWQTLQQLEPRLLLSGSGFVVDTVVGDLINNDTLAENTTLIQEVTLVSVAASAGTYKPGDSLGISVMWNQDMVVSGTPSLILSNGSSATYTSGSGSTELIFMLIVAEGESTSSLAVQSLNGSVSTEGGAASPPVTGALENVSINGVVDRFALDTVFIGNPDNTADTTGFGSVNYGYYIGEAEVTNNQYATFLNAVAATDSHELFAPEMSISRSGVNGSYSYSVDVGQENKPVVYVNFYDASRFANWLMNGQPAGRQNASSTEEGF